ncbi:MAG TPA: methionyl-tRNA formyltransferase [Burkholderiales bacterium]|nr:methionyl-tRNA formyltransferase [Burkholderiales bacterium]
MRIAFAGTPAFAECALAALLAAAHDVVLVLTQPDRPSGRGLRPSASPVKKLASARGLAIFQPETLKDPSALDRIAAAGPEVLVVAAYGLLLPPRALEIAPRGALNIHASLLPRWRGAAPIQRALLAGDRETGITIMKMDAGLDTGPILSRHPIAIAEDDDAQTLHDKLAALGAKAIVAAIAQLAQGGAHAVAQPEGGVTYARKIGKGESEIDWSRPCAELERAVRALRPSPGARSRLRGETVKLWSARCVARQGTPGSVLETGDGGILVACGEGALEVVELQRAGGTRLPAAEFLRGFPISRGERFGTAR